MNLAKKPRSYFFFKLIFNITCLFAGPVGEDWNIMPEIIFEDKCQSYSHIWDINSENETKLPTTDGFDFTADRSSSRHVFTNFRKYDLTKKFYQILCDTCLDFLKCP